MKLQHLTIHRMPGFEQGGFALDGLEGRLNVVVGPNGSGKTTVCRAIRGLLWAERLRHVRPVSLESLWGTGADHAPLRVELDESGDRWQREGRPIDPPALPPEHLADCFTVTVDTLLADTDIHGDLAADLARQMAGGFDLAAVENSPLLDISTRRAGHLQRELQKQRRTLRELKEQHRQLQIEQDRLGGLREQCDQARAARRMLEQLNAASQWHELQEQLSGVEQLLKELPPGMDRLRGDELDRLKDNEKELDRERRRLDEAIRAAETAQGEVDQLALPDGGIPRQERELHAARLDQLRKTDGELREANHRLAEAEARVAEARQRLGAVDNGSVEQPKTLDGDERGNASLDLALDRIDVAALDRLEDWHRAVTQNQQDRITRQERLDLLREHSSAEPGGEQQAVIDALSALRDWFEASSGDDPGRRPRQAALWGLVAVVAILGLILAVASHPLWIALLIPAAAAAGLEVMGRRQTADRIATIQRQFRRTGVAPPTQWDVDHVGERINQLESELAALKAADRDRHEVQLLERRIGRLDEERTELDSEAQQFRNELGVRPDGSPLALVVLADRLKAYRDARYQQAASRGRVEELQREHERVLGQLGVLFQKYGAEPARDLITAEAETATLIRRAEQHEEQTRVLKQADRDGQQAQSSIQRLEHQRRQLLAEAGISAAPAPGAEPDAEPDAEAGAEPGATGVSPVHHGDETADQAKPLDDGDSRAEVKTILAQRLDRLEEYRQLVERRQRLRAQLEPLDQHLAGVEDLKSLTRDEINARSDQCHRLAEGLEELIKQIQDVETRVQAAGRKTAIEQALAEVDSASDALREYRHQAEVAAAGQFLLAEVKAEHRAESQPPVLRKADQWFTEFTRGRYQLVLDGDREGRTGFRALETAMQRGLALEQLSRGTQMQLLLAVRLAFAVGAEQGTQLPILLDEVLSSSDPERFAAVAECVFTLVESGRQVFYFTCQPSDAGAWKLLAEQRGTASPHTVDLAAIRRLKYEPGELLSSSIGGTPSVPAPEGVSPDEYARQLGVAALRPAHGASAAHLAHLVDDPSLLHGLLSAGIATYGQLAALARAGGVGGLLPEPSLRRVRAKAQMIDAFAEAWRVGRGQPLSRMVLEAAGVTETFIDGVSELADELNGDARRLIAELEKSGAERDERAKGFRSSIRDAMVDYLTREGYLDPRNPLDEDTVRARVLAAASAALRDDVLQPSEVDAIFRGLWKAASAE